MASTEKSGELSGEQIAKCIGDLHALVEAVRMSLPPSKPWQRLLHQQFADIERLIQVLRMTLSMGRPSTEVREAKDQLRRALRVSLQHVATGRADMGTKMAVGLACDLGDRIDKVIL